MIESFSVLKELLVVCFRLQNRNKAPTSAPSSIIPTAIPTTTAVGIRGEMAGLVAGDVGAVSDPVLDKSTGVLE